MKPCVFCYTPLGRDSTGKGPNNDAMDLLPKPRFPRSIDTPAPRPVIQNTVCLPFSFYTPLPSRPNTSLFVHSATHPRFRLIVFERVILNATGVPGTLTVTVTQHGYLSRGRRGLGEGNRRNDAAS
jgi:hypothetical protein